MGVRFIASMRQFELDCTAARRRTACPISHSLKRCRSEQRPSAGASVISLRRSLPEKIGVHDPPLLSLGFASDPLNVVHALFQVARHENLIFGSDVGAPVDCDLRVTNGFDRASCVEDHDYIIDIIGQFLPYLAPGRNMNGPSDPVQSDPMSCGESLNAAYSRNHFVFECNGSSGNDPINDP